MNKQNSKTRISAADQFIFTRAGRLHFFCPLCEYHQSTNTIAKIGARHHAQMAVFTAVLMLLAWPVMGLKGALFYLPVWGAFELVYRMRKRQALICQSCGFDPFLYKQDMQKARESLKRHWQTRIETEKLFAGIKLKNYATEAIDSRRSSEAAANGAPGQEAFSGSATNKTQSGVSGPSAP